MTEQLTKATSDLGPDREVWGRWAVLGPQSLSESMAVLGTGKRAGTSGRVKANGVRRLQHCVAGRPAGGRKHPKQYLCQSRQRPRSNTPWDGVDSWTHRRRQLSQGHAARREACGHPRASVFSKSPRHVTLPTHVVSEFLGKQSLTSTVKDFGRDSG